MLTERLVRSAFLTTAALIAVFVPASASHAALLMDPPQLHTMVQAADLVFRGEVEEIEYAFSEPAGPEQVRIPYTFVTYRVDEVYVGRADGPTVTLRFIGGLYDDGVFMEANIVPLFDVGDEDLLLVEGNGRRICPLIRNDQGRLRVIDGRIYSEVGQTCRIAADGTLLYGHHHALPEVLTHEVDGRIRSRTPGPRRATERGESMTIEELISRVESVASASSGMARFESADPHAAFEGPDMTPVPAPAEPARHSTSAAPR